ncbi:ComEA family DNA-binding protein [Leifsonia sp. F6_8S_P_1B]|uniref:ComEA family DNA-binding protein n=1 Tax=Leifsonia williamsii TaxID=3035919 RepID=A0ABT8KE17_9MICO|nr:ComEA family DNA-binding protein [Leifsonia williamsii]MDN4615223.1 ComEA family DNA-binding protein [Leifsonia williamsii]
MRHRAESPEPEGEVEAELPPPRSARVRLGVGAVVVLLLAGLVVAVVLAALGQQGSTVSYGEGSAGPVASPGAHVSASAGPTAAELLVHVAGAVRTPGIVSLPPGARVLDAVAAAGGLTEGADPAGVNLARPVVDGEQLVVPKVGEAPAPAAAGGGGGAGGASAGSAGGAGAVVDLNTATLADLDGLPRIGPALAQRILDWREAHGRFASVDQLREVTGIGDKIFADLKDRVRV